QGMAFRPLNKITRPTPPAFGHSGNRKQSIGFMAITGVDTEYISNGEIMIGSLDDPDFISGTHTTLDDDSQIRPGSQGLGEATRKQLIIHPNSQPPAGDSRLGNLENSRSDRPALSDQRIVHLDPFRREVFAKLAISK